MKEHIKKYILIFFVIFFTTVVVRNSWVSDDAYITFRTVDNFINGWGLTWNTAERVQVYIHPLWLFLLSALYLFTREIFFTSISLSIAISMATVILLSFKIAKDTVSAVLGVLILTLSKAFIDYSSSGLENPLTHLILALFFLSYLKWKFDLKILFLLSLVAALGAVNRMDTLLLFLPPLIYLALKFGKLKSLYVMMLGFSPFILWECFSIFYYGFPFHNPAYAKLLNTDVSGIIYARQGFNYLLNSINVDPLTLLIIIFGIVVSFVGKKAYLIPIAIGILLYLIYTVKIGGCFMSGRYLTAPLFCAVIIISSHNPFHTLPSCLAFVFIILIIGLTSPLSPILSSAEYHNKNQIDEHGIADERAYAPKFLKNIRNRAGPFGSGPWTTEEKRNGPRLYQLGTIGVVGFFAGPDIHIVDQHALSDPLLARLPTLSDQCRIGHFSRKVPEGYWQTLKYGKDKFEDRDLAKFYRKLSHITRGKLSDLTRLITIWNMNTGKYNHLINKDLYNHFNVSDIKAKPGEVISIALESNPTKGYKGYIWQIYDEFDGSVLEFIGSEFRSLGTHLNEIDGEEIWKFKAIRRGETKIFFRYVCRQHKYPHPAKTKTFSVTVR